jgi:hypothetical protein
VKEVKSSLDEIRSRISKQNEIENYLGELEDRIETLEFCPQEKCPECSAKCPSSKESETCPSADCPSLDSPIVKKELLLTLTSIRPSPACTDGEPQYSNPLRPKNNYKPHFLKNMQNYTK